jgi:hypothetical protein
MMSVGVITPGRTGMPRARLTSTTSAPNPGETMNWAPASMARRLLARETVTAGQRVECGADPLDGVARPRRPVCDLDARQPAGSQGLGQRGRVL